MGFGSMFGRVGVGALVGAYSARNESGWGFAGGIAGGALAGGYLGRLMPKKAGSWGMRQLMGGKEFRKQYLSRSIPKAEYAKGKLGNLTGTGLGGWVRRNKPGRTGMNRMNTLLGYGGVALTAGLGASLGSSALRSNRPY
jgi:hypothetical protein